MDIGKVLLIMPPFSMELRYGKGLGKIGTVLPSLGLLYLAAELEKNDYKVTIIDTQIDDWDIERTVLECRIIKPDIVGVYCNTSNYKFAVSLAHSIKESIKVPIIFGGPHVTTKPNEVLNNKSIDYVVIREGEITIVELLDTLNNKNSNKELGNVRGLGFKEKGMIRINTPREMIEDLDSISFPARYLIPMDKYRPSPNQYRRLPVATMITSRGCPYDCTFCDVDKVWTRKYRARSVKNVIEEIKHLISDYKIREIRFWDDIWGLNKKWVNEFCDTVISEGLDIKWSCEWRIDTVDLSLAKKMKKAGCWALLFGVESLDQEILDAVNKKITVEQIINAFRWTKEAGMEIGANFVLGMPRETPEKVLKMINIICKLNPHHVKFNILTPYPGTILYDEIKSGKWGVMVEESYNKLTGYFATFLPYGYKNLEEIEKMRKYAHKKVFLRPNFIIQRLLAIRRFEDVKRYINGAIAIISG